MAPINRRPKGLPVTSFYKLIARRLGVGFSIRVRSAWFTIDGHGVYAGRQQRWEASWSPEDGAVWETAQPAGGWRARSYVKGQGWTATDTAAA